jgi:hypothetical protein
MLQHQTKAGSVQGLEWQEAIGKPACQTCSTTRAKVYPIQAQGDVWGWWWTHREEQVMPAVSYCCC